MIKSQVKGQRADFDHTHDLFPRADHRTDAFVQPYSPQVNVPGPPSPYYTDINQYVGLHQQESGNDLEATAEEAEKERREAKLDRLPSDYAFDHDPHFGQLRSVNEAGGLWSTGFDPSVGPTLGRAGPYIPLYPEPLPPELFKPEKSGIDYAAMYGRPTPQYLDPNLSIGNISRNHLLPDEQSWLKTDEGQEYASGDMLVNRYCQLTSGFRPWRFTPQGNVPIEYPHGGGDKAEHQSSADQAARFHYYDVPAEKIAVRDWTRPPEPNTAPAQRALVREEVVMDEMRDVLSLEYGGIPRYSMIESHRAKHDLESVSKTGSIYSPVDHVTPTLPVGATSDRRFANEKLGPTDRELISTTAYQHHPGGHSGARVSRRAVENIILPFNSNKQNVRLGRETQATSLVKAPAVQNVLLPYNSNKQNVRRERQGAPVGMSNVGGAARNVLLPHVNPEEESKRERAQHGFYKGYASKISAGEPALYSAELVERPGDRIKAISAQDGVSRPGHGHRMVGTGGDQDVNPHDIWRVNNRTSYEEALAHTGAPNMAHFASPIDGFPTVQQEYSRSRSLREATQAIGEPDPSLLSAFRGNPLVPVPVH